MAFQSSSFSVSSLSPRSWINGFGLWFFLICHNITDLAYNAARSSILSVLDGAITIGHLTISDSEGTHYYGNYHKGCNDVHLRVVNDNFWFRMLL